MRGRLWLFDDIVERRAEDRAAIGLVLLVTISAAFWIHLAVRLAF